MMKKTAAILSAVIIILLIQTCPAVSGNCGDINNDGSGPDISDLIYLVNYMFQSGPPPPQMYTSDVNGDGSAVPDIADLVYLVAYMFQSGPPLMCQVSTPNTTTIIPQDSVTVIQEYDTTTGTVLMDTSSYYAQQVAVGDVIVGQDDVDAPNGFLRKVVSITTQGGSIVFETGPATMMEAFEELDLDETHPLNPADVKSVELYNGTTFQPNKDGQTFDVSLNCVLYDLDGDPGTTDDQIKLDGTYAFTADLFAKIKIEWFSLKKFEAGIETNENANLDLIATMQWQFNEEVEFDLAEFRLGAIPIGGVVWLVPTLTVEAHIHGDLTVTFETGITYTQELRYGFGWADDQFYTISESTQNFDFTPPQFTAEFNFEPGASLNASCLIYGVAGPYMAGKAGFHFQSVLSADPCDVNLSFDLEAILYAVVGIECDIIGLDYNHQWQLYTHLIGEWNYPLGGSGTIVIDPDPDAINAPWYLTGPCGYSYSGTGDETLPSLDPGDYTVTWGAVSGWTTPANSTQALTANGTVTFSGTYVEEPPAGTIVIDASPDALNAPWSLAGPNSYTASGNGDATLPDLEPGDYTVTWGAVSGWTTPSNSTQTLAADETVTFSGTYVEDNTIPVLSTAVVSGITQTTAECGGTITSDGGATVTARGVCWSTSPTPTVADSKTTDGTGTGSFTSSITGLTGNTPYYVRAYATNSVGTGYGNVQSFTTEASSGTVTDYDGNVYQTVVIGDQCWMMENLKVTHYRNGDPIPHVTDGGTWSGLTNGAYCEYDNNPANVETYGRLYNWYAVDDSRHIAPEGWHVPTDAEWKQLEMYLGMSQAEADGIGWRGTDEGGKLKETGTTHWLSPNTGATNESGFSALPGGYRLYNGYFTNMGHYALFWSSTEYDSDDAWGRRLDYDYSQVTRGSGSKLHGFSVRCVRD